MLGASRNEEELDLGQDGKNQEETKIWYLFLRSVEKADRTESSAFGTREREESTTSSTQSPSTLKFAGLPQILSTIVSTIHQEPDESIGT